MHFNKAVIICSLLFLNTCAFAEKRIHIVKENDSLMRISNQYYGTHQCWQSILSYNPEIPSKDSLEVNQKIEIPPKTTCLVNRNLEQAVSKPKHNRKETIPNPTANKPLTHDGFIVYTADGKKEKKHISGPRRKYQFKERKVLVRKIKKHKKAKNNAKRKIKEARPYLLQLASYPSKEEAMSKQRGLNAKGIKTFLFQKNIKNKSWFRIQAGPFKSKKEATLYYNNNGLQKFSKNYLIIKTSSN